MTNRRIIAAVAITAALVCATPATAKPTPTYRQAELAAKISDTIPSVLREECVTESNARCVNAVLWKERTAALTLYMSVDAGTSPMCPGFRAHETTVARYLVALAASYKSPDSATASMRSLHARRAWIAAYRRLAKCPSFRWAS